MASAYYRRRFLNGEHTGGMAATEATIDEHGERGDACFDAVFKVADCSRTVELQFGVWNLEDAADVRRKAAEFRRSVNLFVAALLAHIDEAEQRGLKE